ncbi:MAG TPA: hypothetical protein VGM78_11880 [Ilumatobacteraceae bacterium]
MNTRSVLSSLVLSLGVSAVALTGCGSSSSGSTKATIPPDTGLEVIAGPGIRWDKSDYTATAGAVKVALLNHDDQLHTMVIRAADGTTVQPGELEVAKSGAIATGTYDLAPGTYKILCLVPGHEAMKATLTVK